MAKFKRLLNVPEETTHDRLKRTCARNQAAVHPKVRVADVLPIEKSGIADDIYGFALMAHFDFTVTDAKLCPLFVVEFDGPSHGDPTQAERDRKKDYLCERFEMPLLRINFNYIDRTYRDLDLLTWIIEYWFGARDIEKGYESGDIPAAEYLDPMMFIQMPGLERRFPLWIGAEARSGLQKLCNQGKCIEYVPSFIVGTDDDQNWRAFAALRITEASGVMTKTGMRHQRFPVPALDMFDEILSVTIHDLVKDVLAADKTPVAVVEIRARAAEFLHSVRGPSFPHCHEWLKEGL